MISKKLDQVGLEPTTFDFPCLHSYQPSYWSDNEPEASNTYITITRIEFMTSSFSQVFFTFCIFYFLHIFFICTFCTNFLFFLLFNTIYTFMSNTLLLQYLGGGTCTVLLGSHYILTVLTVKSPKRALW